MKPYNRFKSFLLVVLIVSIIFSMPGWDRNLAAHAMSSTGPGSVTQSLTPIIPHSTHVLSRATTQYLVQTTSDQSASTSAYTFSQGTVELNDIKPGDIIVSDVSNLYPNGFLRKVDSVNYSNGKVMLQTSSAALDQAMQQGEVNYSQTLSSDQVQSSSQAPGVTLLPAPAGQKTAAASFTLNINNVVIYDKDGNKNTTNDQVLANGYIQFQPTINFSLKVQNWKLQNLSFVTTVNENSQLKLTYKVDKSFINVEKTLARYNLTPITVFVGVVPVVLTPVLVFNIGANGKAMVGVTAGVTQSLNVRAGLQYNSGTWSPVAGLAKTFTPIYPALLASLDLKGFADANLSLLIYGVAGPYVKVGIYMRLHANISEIPWWKLYAGLNIPVGVHVEVLSHTLANYSKTVFALEIIVAQAPPPTRTPTKVPPTKTFTKIPPSRTFTKTFTKTPTKTFTPTPTLIPPTTTSTITPTALAPTDATVTASPTTTVTAEITQTPTPTLTTSVTPLTPTPSQTNTPVIPTQTITATISATPSVTPTSTIPAPMIVQPSLSPVYSATCGTPPSYWWKNPNGLTGFNGIPVFLTMNAQTAAQSSNVATFHLNIGLQGQYKIEVYIAYHPGLNWPCTNVAIYGDTSRANYQVHHSAGTTGVIVDQVPLNNQWATLGTFRFNAGSNAGDVVISDLTGEAFSTRFVSINVIRITWVGP